MCFQYEVSIDLDILIYLRFMSALTLLKGLVITYFYKHACRTMALEKLLSKKGAPRRSVPSDTLFSYPLGAPYFLGAGHSIRDFFPRSLPHISVCPVTPAAWFVSSRLLDVFSLMRFVYLSSKRDFERQRCVWVPLI